MTSLEEFKIKKHNDILRSMIDYMNIDDDEDYDYGYSQKDIDKCGKILDDYIDELKNCKEDKKLIMKSVQKVVHALNKLNEKCNYCLIETDQREYLVPFIESAAIVAGLTNIQNDITEAWREW